MSSTDRNRSTLRLWMLLTAAFFVTAAGSGLAVLQLSTGRALANARLEVASAARNIAVRANMQSPAAAAETVQRYAVGVPGLRSARFVLVQGDTPVGLVPDRESAIEAARTGTATISEALSIESDSRFLAHAPVFGPNGVHGLAILEISKPQVGDELRHLRAVGLLGLLVAGVLGAGFAAGFTRQMLRGPNERRILRLLRSKRFLRLSTSEVALAAVAGFILLGGILGLFTLRNLRHQAIEVHQTQGLHQDLIRDLALAGGRVDPELFRRAATLGLKGRTTIELTRSADASLGLVRERIVQLREQQVSATRGIAVTMLAACVLTVIALVLLRATASREIDLEEAEQVAARSESARHQIVESLPVGFYTFGADHVLYCNDAWRRMVEQDELEDSTDALGRALHPDEHDAVLGALRDAVHTGSGFGFNHRLVMRSGEVRHVESRGVPILDERGQVEHVVGFTIDVTSRVRTRDLLESKTREVEATNARLRQALGDLEENFEAMVTSLVKAVEAKDPYTAGHSERVMAYSVMIGEALGLSPSELRVLRMGALIHDVGKIGVPDAVLTKPAPLDPDEFAIVRSHPEVGARMVEGVPIFRACVPIVRYHHERLDGTGYPAGLAGDNISLPVRIVAVADCFDAMTSTRAYRAGLDPEFVLETLRKSAAMGALDERIVREMADIVKRGGVIPHDPNRAAA